MNTTTHQAVQPEFRLLVLLVSIGFFMQALDTTIVNTAIPGMAAQLNENPLQMHGVIVAYVLSVAACIPLSGWLADRFGMWVIAEPESTAVFSGNTRRWWRIADARGAFGIAEDYSTLAVPFRHEFNESGWVDWPIDGSNFRGMAS